MKIREATDDDGDAIRDVAERSMEASYSLSPRTIESAIEQWYGGEALETTLADEDVVFLVAEEGNGDGEEGEDGESEKGSVVGFAESVLETDTGEGDVLWLHVDPAARGGSVGTDLFERTREELTDRGAERLRGMVLEDNREGNDFYERFEFVKAEERVTVIDGESYVEFVYVEGETGEGETGEGETPIDEDASISETIETNEGSEVFVDHEDVDMGSKGPFFVVYDDAAYESRHGYYCGNCRTLDTAMDAMGRVQCNDCGNTRKPTRWDAAYL